MPKNLTDMRVGEINKYLDKIRCGDIQEKYKWRLELTNWLESEGISRQAAYCFSSNLYINTICSDDYYEVLLAIGNNEEINRFFKSWLVKQLEGQRQ